MRIVVIGAGVGGLGAALSLSRRGHHVTLVERDATPLPSDARGAFDWDRRGAPQVRHSHAFLARLRNLLRDRYPDVLDALHEAGATEMDFIAMLPEGMDRTPMDGDADLVALACRRTTFEWVLRRIVTHARDVTLLDGCTVVALIGGLATADAPAVVRGVELEDGRRIDADLVVAAGGRRSDLVSLIAPLGVEIVESTEDTGIIYFSRFFELNADAEYPEQVGPIGGDLGYLKYGVFLGDNRTFSITFAIQADDDELRAQLLDPETFLRCAGAVPATVHHVDGRARSITGVNVMARLLNRSRRFTDDSGRPLVTGFSAVGDAHTCTNPLYGRGCSLAMVQAELLGQSVDEFPDDPIARARRFEELGDAEVLPWYRASVAQDRVNRQAADAPADGQSDDDPLRSIMRDGLFPAMRVDPVVLRAFLRMFNLLQAPDSLLADVDVISRVMMVYQDRDKRPAEPPLGPDRSALLALLRA